MPLQHNHALVHALAPQSYGIWSSDRNGISGWQPVAQYLDFVF